MARPARAHLELGTRPLEEHLTVGAVASCPSESMGRERKLKRIYDNEKYFEFVFAPLALAPSVWAQSALGWPPRAGCRGQLCATRGVARVESTVRYILSSVSLFSPWPPDSRLVCAGPFRQLPSEPESNRTEANLQISKIVRPSRGQTNLISDGTLSMRRFRRRAHITLAGLTQGAGQKLRRTKTQSMASNQQKASERMCKCPKEFDCDTQTRARLAATFHAH